MVRAHRFELIALLTGACVMALEIVGARLVAPYFGSSIYVWTAMIGVILGALALGYSVGGVMADKRNPRTTLPIIIITAAALVLCLGLVQETILNAIASAKLDIRLSALLAALILFSLPSLLIGAVSPHLAKIRITSLASSGKSVGRLEAAGAIGSIAGTFLCGYVLLGLFGSRAIVAGIAVTLLMTSLLAAPRGIITARLGILVLAALYIASLQIGTTGSVLADVDTSYSRYQVQRLDYNGQSVVALINDRQGIQSAISEAKPSQLVFSYIQQFMYTLQHTKNVQRILVIGGGTFTFPMAAAQQYPNVQVDAVEIDPALTNISERYFNVTPTTNLRIINEDGRAYLNTTKEKYDMVFLDAYSSLSPPFQLATEEALTAAKNHMNSRGVLVSNIIGKSDAYNDNYLQAMLGTHRAVFSRAELLPAEAGTYPAASDRNYILIASDNQDAIPVILEELTTKPAPSTMDGLVLRDDFAPIEQLQQ